jgi:hypothetical protein
MPYRRITDAIIIPLDRTTGLYLTCYRVESGPTIGVWLSDRVMKNLYGEKEGNSLETQWFKAVKRKKAGSSSQALEWISLVPN